MALRKTVDFRGVIVPNAYVRVQPLTIQAGNAQMEFGIQIMVNATASPFEVYAIGANYNLEGGNPIRQAYDYLKTLERFQGAEDC